MTQISALVPPTSDTLTGASAEDFTLLLVDGMNLVRRVYEANLAPDSDEKAQGAIRSSMGSLRRALEEHTPTHALLAFDYGGTTWRHEIYAAYRCNRKPMPAPLKNALPGLFDQLRDKGFALRCIPGVEADDVIGTVVHRVADKPFKTIVLSTDKDLATLMGEKVKIRDHFNNEWRDTAWCERKFGVPPHLLADLLALTGDSSDDIPGVDKIGPKTAAKLLLEHGSLAGVLEAAPGIKGKLGERLALQREQALLSRDLVSLKTDVVLDIRSCTELRVPVWS